MHAFAVDDLAQETIALHPTRRRAVFDFSQCLVSPARFPFGAPRFIDKTRALKRVCREGLHESGSIN